jgi:hypothetical protein
VETRIEGEDMRVLLTLALLVGMTFASSSSALAQAETTTTNQTFPVEAFVGNPCAGPEPIDISGNMKVVTHTTVSANGNFHFVAHLNYQGVSGTGRTSGTQYRATDAGTSTFNGGGDDSANEFTNEFTFQLISAGNEDNFRVKGLIHMTVNANGETTSEVIRLEAYCSG